MRKLLSLAAAFAVLLALLAPAAPALSTSQPGVKFTSTEENTATDFGANVRDLCICNEGANEIFYAFGAAAVATPGVNEISAGSTVCWSDIEIDASTTTGARSAVVGIINSAGETSVVSLYPVIR